MGMRSAIVAESVTPLPTLEALIEGKGTEAPQESQGQPAEQAGTPPKAEDSRLDQIEREQKHRRELFAQQKRIKELEAKLGDSSNKASILDAKNPIKALAKDKNLSQDDIIKMALDSMDDDLTDTEKKQDLSNMTPQEIAKLVREQMEAENAEKDKVKAQSEEQSKAIAGFKKEIADKAKEMATSMPLVDALGGADAVYDLIDKQFAKDSQEFGEDYAKDNMLSIEEAIKKTNETLALNVKDALKSKHLRDFIMKVIKEDSSLDKKPDQSEDDEQLEDEAVTLTNSGHRAATEATGKPSFRSNEEELDYLINKLI